ncbi:MAG: YcaQ family DNA glycosylase [Acidobacteriaceae bacterium]|nr:YcaQ family DNA glycosylase [Acidobacteriaceae bacterium]
MPSVELSRSEARRIALAAQGLDSARPSCVVGPQDIERVIRLLGVLQIDCVNVLVPAHYMVLFSRLGAFDRGLLQDVVYRSRRFTEQWAHEASIIPIETWPLLRHRMQSRRIRPYVFEHFLVAHPNYVEQILRLVQERGPLAAEDLPDPQGVDARIPGTWVGTVRRATLEAHFTRGLLAVHERRADFSRVFDVAERAIPKEHFLRHWDPNNAERKLLCIASRALGIASAADLADYFRTPVRSVRSHLGVLVEKGDLLPATVEGWREQAYLDSQAVKPGSTAAHALLSPFDPLIWFRARVKRLFDFDYRIEIFVPEEKRKWGYYVLPFLMGERLVARVDLKADRKQSRLAVLAVYLEPGFDGGAVAHALWAELQALAGWLGLERIHVGQRGNLSRMLRKCAAN